MQWKWICSSVVEARRDLVDNDRIFHLGPILFGKYLLFSNFFWLSDVLLNNSVNS